MEAAAVESEGAGWCRRQESGGERCKTKRNRVSHRGLYGLSQQVAPLVTSELDRPLDTGHLSRKKRSSLAKFRHGSSAGRHFIALGQSRGSAV
ncbi:MAG: hypothetical protein ACLQIQ_17440 [Beijerinckiaceae bacterium]